MLNAVYIYNVYNSNLQLIANRYKAPLLARFEEEIFQNGQLPQCKDSFSRFWKFLVEAEDTEKYIEKTREAPEDREECVLLHHVDKNSKKYIKYVEDEKKFEEELLVMKGQFEVKLEEGRQRRQAEFERRQKMYDRMNKHIKKKKEEEEEEGEASDASDGKKGKEKETEEQLKKKKTDGSVEGEESETEDDNKSNNNKKKKKTNSD